jgi:hypothetical protein
LGFYKDVTPTALWKPIKALDAISALGQVSWSMCSAGAPKRFHAGNARQGACAPHRSFFHHVEKFLPGAR